MASLVIQTKDAVWRRIGDEIVVIKGDGQSTHVLNKTAALIWEKCDGKYGIDEIAAYLCERFNVSHEQARADVMDIIDKLKQVGIINMSEEARE